MINHHSIHVTLKILNVNSIMYSNALPMKCTDTMVYGYIHYEFNIGHIGGR